MAYNTTSLLFPAAKNSPEALKRTPLLSARILYVPGLVTLAITVLVTPRGVCPLYNVPVCVPEQSHAETTAVPPDEESFTKISKTQFSPPKSTSK